MPDQAIIDQLIATYRELNLKVRGLNFGNEIAPEELVGKTDSVPAILFALRNRELNVSQAVKQILLGGEATGDDEPAVLSEQQIAAGTSPRVLLSQFGTARESILSQVRELPDETWDQVFKTPRGEMSLKAYLQTLVDRDKERLAQLDAELAKVKV